MPLKSPKSGVIKQCNQPTTANIATIIHINTIQQQHFHPTSTTTSHINTTTQHQHTYPTSTLPPDNTIIEPRTSKAPSQPNNRIIPHRHHTRTLNSSAANLRTAVKGVASGTLSTLKGSFGSEVKVTLNVTLDIFNEFFFLLQIYSLFFV